MNPPKQLHGRCLILRFTISVVLLGMSAGSINSTRAGTENRTSELVRSQSNTQTPTQSPEIVLEEQPGSPLRLSILDASQSTAHKPGFRVRVDNVGTEPIRAYAIRYEITVERPSPAGMFLVVAASEEALFQPSQSREESILEGTNYGHPVSKVVVFVDYIEFLGGTTWGLDVTKSSVRLAGMRAGVQKAQSDLLELLHEKGGEAVKRVAESLEISPPPDQPEEFQSGFRTGHKSIIIRLIKELEKGDVADLESLIRRPFAPSGRRQK